MFSRPLRPGFMTAKQLEKLIFSTHMEIVVS